MSSGTEGVTGSVSLTPGERAFIDGVAAHYHEAHGVTWPKARTMAWMIISDPPEQSVSEICAVLGIQPDDIEQLIEQLVLAELYEVVERPGEEPRYRLAEDGYSKVVSHTFASWPRYLEIFQHGLKVLEDATPERRRRIAEIEELFSSIVPDLADMSRRWNEIAKQPASA